MRSRGGSGGYIRASGARYWEGLVLFDNRAMAWSGIACWGMDIEELGA